MLPMLTLLVFQKEKGSSRLANCEIWKRILMWGIFLITVMLIWSAMYLSFTPVGEASIAGVQARYYLPLIYLGALLLSNSKIKVEISKYGLAKTIIYCCKYTANCSGMGIIAAGKIDIGE